MKINVERGALLKALNHVQSVVERRNTIPILSNVLIEAGKGELKLTATDLDIEIVEALPADVLRNGSATAPAHMLYDIVRKLPDGAQVQVELLASEGGRLAVSAGTSRFELSCLPREDFPQMAAGTLPHKFRLAADDLKRLALGERPLNGVLDVLGIPGFQRVGHARVGSAADGILMQRIDDRSLVAAEKPELTVLPTPELNAETPAHLLDEDITPTDRLFVRNTGFMPGFSDAELANWTLTIDGCVRAPRRFSLDALKAPRDLSALRWTVDTQDDLDLLRMLFNELQLTDQNVSYRELLTYVRERPQLMQLNRGSTT